MFNFAVVHGVPFAAQSRLFFCCIYICQHGSNNIVSFYIVLRRFKTQKLGKLYRVKTTILNTLRGE
jgi:hypothetical protein